MELVRKIDIHVHATTKVNLPSWVTYRACYPRELIEMYDELGIEKGVVLPLISPEQVAYPQMADNDAACSIVAGNPDRFVWFANVDPRWGRNSGETDFVRILDYFKSRGAKGVGEVTGGVYFDDPRAYALYRACAACDMPLLFHIGAVTGEYGMLDTFGLPHLEKALQDNPDTMFLAHSQRWWSHITGDINEVTYHGYPSGPVAPGGRVVELMRKYPNLCGDLSAGSGCNAITRDPEFGYAFLEEFQDRLFYGTDICSPCNRTDPMLYLGKFLDEAMQNGKISYEAYYKICRGNALKIIER